MQSESQLIHTPVYLFRSTENACLSNLVLVEQCNDEHRLSANGSLLVVRNGFYFRVANTEERQNKLSALNIRKYSWPGYQFENPDAPRRTNQKPMQACKGNDTLGTLTLNIDSEAGLFAEKKANFNNRPGALKLGILFTGRCIRDPVCEC